MREYLVMASIYDDLATSANIKKIRFYDAYSCTPIRKLVCNSIEELHDLTLDNFGEEYVRLRRYVCLYAQIGNTWKRITD